MTDIFHSWDRDGSGLIGKAEFRRAIRAVGFDMPTAELDALFDEIDADGSGQIEFGELDGEGEEGVKGGCEGGCGCGCG